MNTTRIRDEIIQPMLKKYQPPRHLAKGSPEEVVRNAIEFYGPDLAGFDVETLRKGWRKVCAEHTAWTWPAPGVIVKACRESSAAFQPATQKQRVTHPWEIKAAEVSRMVTDYCSAYVNSQQLRTAVKEGWGTKLARFVQSQAKTQAQAICECQSIGWDAEAFGYGYWLDTVDDVRNYLGSVIDSAKNRGAIEVCPPEKALLWMRGM